LHRFYKTSKANPLTESVSNRQKPNYNYAIFSVALVLFLLGLFGVFLLHTPKWIKAFKEDMVLMVEFKEGTSSEQIQSLMSRLEESEYIIPASVEFIRKEDVALEMKSELGEDWEALEIANPFFDMVYFNLKGDYLNKEGLEKISNWVKEDENVSDVFYQGAIAEQINANLRKIGWSSFILGLLFIIIAVSLIHSTIRLAMYSDRFLIKNMQLVGASWNFISKPYLEKGIKNGLWSALISIVMLLLILSIMNGQFPDLKLNLWLESPISFLMVVLSLIFLGILISGLSTYYVVNKYLNMSLDNLY